jgi:ABC-2 type transport system ATP-binding protein
LDLTVEENLEFFAEIHKVVNYRDRLEFLLRFANLQNFRKSLIANLSGGMKQKLALISALIYNPEILLLDEPTTGVDPISRREFWFLLNQLVVDGKTIIFATHLLNEVETLSDSVILINDGKIIQFAPYNEVSENIKKVFNLI